VVNPLFRSHRPRSMRGKRRLNPPSSGPQTGRPSVAGLSNSGRVVQKLNSRRTLFHSRRSSVEGPDSPQNDDDPSFSDSPQRQMFEPMASDAFSARRLQPPVRSTGSNRGLRAAMGRLSLVTGVTSTSTRTMGNSTVGTAPRSNLTRKSQQKPRPTKRQLQYQTQETEKRVGILRESSMTGDYEAPLSDQPSGRMRRSRASRKLKKLSNKNMARKDSGAAGFRDNVIKAGRKDGTRTRRATSYTSIEMIGDDSDEESVSPPAVAASASTNIEVPSAMELLRRSEAVALPESRSGQFVGEVRPSRNDRASESTQQASNASNHPLPRRASYSSKGDGSTTFCHTFHSSGTTGGGSEVDERLSAAASSTATRIVDTIQNNLRLLLEAECVDEDTDENDITRKQQIQPQLREKQQHQLLPLLEGEDVGSGDGTGECPMQMPDDEVLIREGTISNNRNRKSERLAEAAAETTDADENASFVSALTGTTGLYPIEALKDAPRQEVKIVAFNPDGSTASPNYDAIAVEEGIWRHVSELLEDCLTITGEGSVGSGTVVSETVTDTRSVSSRVTRRSHDWDLLSQVGAGGSGRRSQNGSCGDEEVSEVRMARAAISSFANFFHDDSASTSCKSVTFHENRASPSVGVRTPMPLHEDIAPTSSTLSQGEEFIASRPALSATGKRSDISKVNKESVSPHNILRQSLLEISCRSMNYASKQNVDIDTSDITRIAPESEGELWVRQCLSRMKDAALGKIAMDTFSAVLVDSMPGEIKAAIEKPAVTPSKGQLLDASEEKKALLFGPHLTLFEVFRWSLQINIDYMANDQLAHAKRDDRKKQDIKRSSEQSSVSILDNSASLEHETDASIKDGTKAGLLGIQTDDYSRSSEDKTSKRTDTILSAAMQLGLVAADGDKPKKAAVTAGGIQYTLHGSSEYDDRVQRLQRWQQSRSSYLASSPPLGTDNSELPIRRSTYNTHSSAVRFTLPKSERVSTSDVERPQEEYRLAYGITTQDKGLIAAKRPFPRTRRDCAASLVDSLRKMRSASKMSDSHSSFASGTSDKDHATPTETFFLPSSTIHPGLEVAAFADSAAHLSIYSSDSDSDSGAESTDTQTMTSKISATAMEHIFKPQRRKVKLVRQTSGNLSTFSGSEGTKSGDQPKVDLLASCVPGIADSALSMPSTLKEYA